MKRTTLKLRKNTIRILGETEIRDVVGGLITSRRGTTCDGEGVESQISRHISDCRSGDGLPG